MARRYLLGFDVGSSSVKASLTDVDSGENAKLSLLKIMAETGAKGEDILAIGISYQMHGLVCVDKQQNVLRPSIIWCDSRAVPYGDKAFRDLGEERCLQLYCFQIGLGQGE